MTRAQFAMAVGAPEKWIHNAGAALRRRVPYTLAAARRLAVARAIQAITPVPLVVADRIAAELLAAPIPKTGTVGLIETEGGSVTLDLRRVLSTFAARLALARAHAPRRPGRPRSTRRRRSPGARARAAAYGVDLSLVNSNLRRTPDERLRALDDNAAFVSAVRRRSNAARPPAREP